MASTNHKFPIRNVQPEVKTAVHGKCRTLGSRIGGYRIAGNFQGIYSTRISQTKFVKYKTLKYFTLILSIAKIREKLHP